MCQASIIAAYIHVRAHREQQVTFELFSDIVGAAVDSAIVNLTKDEQMSVLPQHCIEKPETMTMAMTSTRLLTAMLSMAG